MLWVCAVDADSYNLVRLSHTMDGFRKQIAMTCVATILYIQN